MIEVLRLTIKKQKKKNLKNAEKALKCYNLSLAQERRQTIFRWIYVARKACYHKLLFWRER